MFFCEVKHRSRICNYNLYLQTIELVMSKVNFPLKVQGSSIVSPSVLHRSSIETMDHRWSIDGESMEYLRRKNGRIAKFLARIIPCSWGEKSRKREKSHTTKEIYGGVGVIMIFVSFLDVIKMQKEYKP